VPLTDWAIAELKALHAYAGGSRLCCRKGSKQACKS
jgi:hypothetical protein